ncbi:general secretion pathway protein GspA [Sphingomonas sp. AAP5]|uniref:XrtA/PEP-CTERM system-associated ATPase n=1 Tax=Sphingomonas sp. AAP5 TaxID=1523415 RepID=UPI001056F2CC|nr:XrtA/PEP-CTERM system-associated ATPase [Sphingomonas sp. AAP5]QBM74977.1 general secretion pathway protein GspA [Sphingomonas sp. AAP5]
MYEDYYGLRGRPFQLTPDPRFWFETATHRKAMAYLGYGLAQGEGFIVITGDVGAGKTTLVGHLMDTVDATRLHVIKIVSTQIEAEDLLRIVAGGLEIESDGLTKAQLLVAIERGLRATARAGRRTLLIVDEAQALPVSSLEELRMLSNFQTGSHALLQIFLLGQPEFRERLHGSDRLEQLRQRVIAVHHLDPMERDEVEPYMRHRLAVAGWTGRPGFTPGAHAAFYDGTDGVPRRLNQLAGRVLLYAAIEQLETIDAHAVATVLADIAGDMPGVKAIAIPEREALVATPEAEPVPSLVPEPDAPAVPHSDPVAAPEPVADVEPEPEPELEPELDSEPEPELEPDFKLEPEPEPGPDLEAEDETPHAPDPVVLAVSEPVPEVLPVPAFKVRPIADDAEDHPPIAPREEPIASTDVEPDTTLAEQVAALTARVEEQDVALRRVLKLLVDWAESGQAPGLAMQHDED